MEIVLMYSERSLLAARSISSIRPLLRAFIASFTTRDDTPPAIVSFTPEDGLVQAATNSVVRLQFDESIQSGASIILQGPSGLVAGSTALGVGGLVLVFVPQFELPPNTTFTAIVSGGARSPPATLAPVVSHDAHVFNPRLRSAQRSRSCASKIIRRRSETAR
jgi:hypothetical protein